MRNIFKFRADEITTPGTIAVIDLDSIITFLEINLNAEYSFPTPTYAWSIVLASGSISVTKAGYDRAMTAWISN
jgi:hypothetical protein